MRSLRIHRPEQYVFAAIRTFQPFRSTLKDLIAHVTAPPFGHRRAYNRCLMMWRRALTVDMRRPSM